MFDKIEKVVKIFPVGKSGDANPDLTYWLSRPPEERLAAVEFLRSQVDETSRRLQRIGRIVQRQQR
jgi:hypothetical protein